jgi:hypothetical protein
MGRNLAFSGLVAGLLFVAVPRAEAFQTDPAAAQSQPVQAAPPTTVQPTTATPTATPPPAPAGGDTVATSGSKAQTAITAAGPLSWLDTSKLPFIPVPLIAVDPNSGTTLGILPTWIHTNDQQEITRIIAPDLLYNPYFGIGAHFRLFSYPSEDEHWSVVTQVQEHVERGIDFEYEAGRLRNDFLTFHGSLIVDRDGTPRFYGLGNESPQFDDTDYTQQRELVESQLGFNLSHDWQLLYSGRAERIEVLPGTLGGLTNLQTRFGNILGIGTNSQILNRLSVVYDSRDNVTIPTQGMKWVAYGGLASRRGLFNDSMYSETGVDGRGFWTITPGTILATHMALRYLLSTDRVPFWALSSIGGGDSIIGGSQPLRGYGEGRFYDRDSFSTTFELRRRIASFNAIATRVEIEVTPFIDLGRVFARNSTFPLDQLHQVYGIGFRGIARPSVVGYVDIGYGSDGVAAFTGIAYPF